MDEKLRCVCCGDVIGAYEPLVVCLDGRARGTSKMAEPDDGAEREYYHRACYTAHHGEPEE